MYVVSNLEYFDLIVERFGRKKSWVGNIEYAGRTRGTSASSISSMICSRVKD